MDFLVALSLHTGELGNRAVQVIHIGSDDLLSPFLSVMAEDEAVGIGIDQSAAQDLKLTDFGGSLRNGILCHGHGEGVQDSVDLILEGVNRYLMELAKEQIRLAFVQSEKEVSDLHQRTKEGIATARLNGKQIGRQKNAQVVTKKSIKAKEIIKRVSRDFDGNLTDAEVIELVGIARNTYYKYKKELYASEQEAQNEQI